MTWYQWLLVWAFSSHFPLALIFETQGCESNLRLLMNTGRPSPLTCRRWLYQQHVPRSGASPQNGDRPRPSPPLPSASPPATCSSRRWPESSTCPYSAGGRDSFLSEVPSERRMDDAPAFLKTMACKLV